MKPITPQEAIAQRKAHPDVVEVVNTLLAESFDGKEAEILQSMVIARLVAKGWLRQQILDDKMLDFEPVYRTAGWKVKYEKPGYNETGDAYWRFSK